MASCVAVIPARGGSKRIPNKNVRQFFGRPIIDYSISAALDSGLFDRVIVSTDSPEIADVAMGSGAEVPFVRPPELSNDTALPVDVLSHALEFLRIEERYDPDYLCCIFATAPTIRVSDLHLGYELVSSGSAPAAFTVTTFAFPILRALRLTAKDTLEMVWPEHELTRSNDLQEYYHDAGQFYWLQCDAFCRKPQIVMPGARPIVLPRWLVQDIDTVEDWEQAELLYSAIRTRAP